MLIVKEKPETTVGLHVYKTRDCSPSIRVVEIVRHTDKSVWVWDGFNVRKHPRFSVMYGSYFPASEMESAHAYAEQVTQRYIKRVAKELKEAKALMKTLDAFKARGYKLRKVKT